MSSSTEDYVDDWKHYWSFKYNDGGIRRRLERAANNPASAFLPVRPTHLNPQSDDYDWSIEVDDLQLNPDFVLDDAREGFREFVEESEITDEPADHYDTLTINLTDSHFDQRDYFWTPMDIDSMNVNQISSLSGTISSIGEIIDKPAVIAYECPSGHIHRIIQPIYINRNINICPEEGCMNNVYPSSLGTEFTRIVKFTVEFGRGGWRSHSTNSSLTCVASGLYTEDQVYEKLVEDISISLTGILRNIIMDDHTPYRTLEVLGLEV